MSDQYIQSLEAEIERLRSYNAKLEALEEMRNKDGPFFELKRLSNGHNDAELIERCLHQFNYRLIKTDRHMDQHCVRESITLERYMPLEIDRLQPWHKFAVDFPKGMILSKP